VPRSKGALGANHRAENSRSNDPYWRFGVPTESSLQKLMDLTRQAALNYYNRYFGAYLRANRAREAIKRELRTANIVKSEFCG
jgi:hypothetical protein